VPANGAPGGTYYTFLASANIESGSIKTTVQAAILLFLTVNGKLIYTSNLIGSSIQRIVLSSQLTYKFKVLNTGNVYFFIYVSGKLHGLGANVNGPSVTHLVMPGKIREFSGAIPHPFLPGLYKVAYGYMTSSGTVVQQSRFILYVPPWSIALVLIILLVLNLRYTKGRKKRSIR
jgi:hypothetical protein